MLILPLWSTEEISARSDLHFHSFGAIGVGDDAIEEPQAYLQLRGSYTVPSPSNLATPARRIADSIRLLDINLVR
jgi:hypothetical protein